MTMSTIASWLFANVTEIPWAAPISSLGVAGVLAWLTWHLITKYLPTVEERHRTERAELHNDLMKMVDEQSEHLTDIGVKLSEINTGIGSVREAIERTIERDTDDDR